MVMKMTVLLLRLSIAAFLSKIGYLLIFRFLVFFCGRLIEYVSPLIAAAMLHSSYRRLIEVLRIA